MKVCLGIITYGFLFCTLAESIGSRKQSFTLEEATFNKISQEYLTHTWISDSKLEYLDQFTGDVNVLDTATLKSTLFLPKSVMEKFKGVSYSVSNDRKFVLIKYDSRIVNRLSRISKYAVYVKANKTYLNVAEGKDIQLATWSPTGNALIYVRNNNLFYIPSITATLNPQPLTRDGKPGAIFNGINDWAYEEEIASSTYAFWFSPKSDQLVFIKYIDTEVDEIKWIEYGNPANYSNLYPKIKTLRIPKYNSKIPAYELWWVNLKTPSERKLLQYYSSDNPGKQLILRTTWVRDNAIAAVYSNIIQNESEIVIYAPIFSNKGVTLTRNGNSRGWVENLMPRFATNPNRELKIKAQPVGKNEFDHLTLITKERTTVLTNGEYEVVEIINWDKTNKVIYYRATEENSPSSINVYRISEAKGSKPYCLSCHIISPEGNKCKHATATFSKKFSYVVIQCNGPDPRMTYLFRNEHPMHTIPKKVLAESDELRFFLKNKTKPEIVNLRAPIPGSFEAEVRLFLPPGMDKTGKTKYPMILYVYGGINTKLIHDDFKIDWEYHLTTNLSIIYAIVDARNTKHKGKNMLYDGYMKIGTTEIADQITVVKYLESNFDFIDTRRIGVWGWGFGGYATLRILQFDTENVFKCAIAIAPVVDWALYDFMWSARYFKTFEENKKGYEISNLMTNITNLSDKNFYIITGNADDNVPYSQVMLLIRQLQLRNILFKFQTYPDEGHNLLGVRSHLYYSMNKYWKNCFNLTEM